MNDFRIKPARSLPGHLKVPADRTITKAEAHRAALACCARATDTTDARELLNMLGLLEVTS